nr:PAS domain S-box protein [Lysobacter sp. CFH 32150]
MTSPPPKSPVLASDAYADPSSDARFRLAMASSGIGMAIVSLDGAWLNVNPALCSLLGYAREALLGHNMREVVHPDDLGEADAAFSDLVHGRIDTIDAERLYLHSDGHALWVQVNTALMRDAESRPQYLISQLRDISAQREAERALRELNDTLELRVQARTADLQALNRQLELFAFGVSHDLRAPLRAIDSFSWLLEQHSHDQLDELGREHLQRIRGAATKMASMIDGLLELSRATRAELRPAPVDLSLLADWVGAELQDAHPGRLAEVVVQPDLHTIGDERLLKTMLGQLMDNAWKFSSERECTRIEVGGNSAGADLELWVRDQGSGFDMTYADKLGEPFQRLHGPEQGGGNGLGLAIAKRVIERHGGQLRIESIVGVGTTVRVLLPETRSLGPRSPEARAA